jgi:phage terminase large subunit-like protein
MGRKLKTIEQAQATGSGRVSTKRAEARRALQAQRRADYSRFKKPPKRALIRPATRCHQLVPGYDPNRVTGGAVFKPAAARAAVAWIHDNLRHVEGEWAGQPFRLEPWEQAIVMNIYGWLYPDGTRRYREVFIYLPRKNGKTLLACALSLHSFFCDGEPGAGNFCAAAERKQAGILWNVARQQILLNKELEDQCDLYQHGMTLKADRLTSFQAVSAEAGTKHGYNPHFVVVDETHKQKDRTLIEAFRTGMGARRQPLLIHITTADSWRESICNELYEHACKVRDGVVDDASFLPFIYEAFPDDDWTDPKVWEKANPNYGVSVKPEFLEAEMKRAEARPSEIDPFRRYYLNIRTHAENAALDVRQWDACEEQFTADDLKGEECYGGLDLSKTVDLTAFALWFPKPRRALCWFWIPSDTAVKKEQDDRVPYLTWERQGFLELTPGNVVDYPFVRDRVQQICSAFKLRDIGYDPWNGRQMAQELGNRGMEMVEFIQGPRSYNEPCQELERMIVGGELEHDGNKVLRWCASNVMWRRDANNNVAPDKQKSSGRIDGISALAMAIGRSIVTEEPAESVYSARGVRQL